MDGIARRWLVIEGDQGTLEQQWQIHKQLAKGHRLCCLCWSGGKSLHGWYFVESYSERQCFELYVEAIGLGVSDCKHGEYASLFDCLMDGTRHATSKASCYGL